MADEQTCLFMVKGQDSGRGNDLCEHDVMAVATIADFPLFLSTSCNLARVGVARDSQSRDGDGAKHHASLRQPYRVLPQ